MQIDDEVAGRTAKASVVEQGSNKVALSKKKEQLRNVTETLSPKTGNRKPEKNYCLETVSNELLGRGNDTSFSSPTSPSIYEVVQNIYLVVRLA